MTPILSLALVLAAPTLQDRTEPQDLSVLHPASAEIVFQIPDIQGLIDAYPSTAIGKMLDDPDLHRAIGAMMNGGDPETAEPVHPIDLALRYYDEAVAGGEIPPLLRMASGLSAMSFSLDVENDDVLAFVNETQQKGPDHAAEAMGLRVVVDFVDSEARQVVADQLEQLMGGEAPRQMSLQAMNFSPQGAESSFGSDSVAIYSYELSPDAEDLRPGDVLSSSIKMISGGRRLAFLVGNVDAPEYAALVAAGGYETSAASKLTAGRETFGVRAPSTTHVFEGFVQPFVERALAEQEPMALPLLDLAEGLFGTSASMFIRGGHWRVDIDPKSGQFRTEGLHEPSKVGPTAGLLGARTLPEDALDLAPADALVATVTSLDKNVLQELMSQAAGRGDAERVEEEMAAIEEQYGFRPDRDLVAPLGSAISFSLKELTSPFSPPDLQISAKLEDREAFVSGMDGLFSMLESEPAFVLEREPYKKISMIYRLQMPELFAGAGLDGIPVDLANYFAPAIAIMDDRFVLGLNRAHVRKEVRKAAKAMKEGTSRATHEELSNIGAAQAATVSYADWASFLGGIYNKMKAVGPFIASIGLPFDPNALPSAETMTRHFTPSHRSVRVVEGAVRHSSVSSFGPELGLVPIAMGLGSMTFARAVAVDAVAGEIVEEPMFEEVQIEDVDAGPASTATAVTEQALTEISVAITLYQLANDGKAPNDLAALTETTENYPEGYLEGGVPTDGWDNDFVYATKDSGFELYSKGPNGVDDDGGGDDISVD